MLKPRVSDSVTRRSNVDTESLNDVLNVCAYWNYEGISKNMCVYTCDGHGISTETLGLKA